MLVACRTQQNPDVQPTFDLTGTDVEGFLDHLHEFHQAFHSCFVRREPREHFLRYMAGQLSSLERKSIEPMAIHIEGGNIRGMQRFISDDVWKEDEMRQTYHGMVADEMGEPQGMIIFDESGFVKKGQDSVGVARQYCGTLGKVENGQVGVFAAYASSKGYALGDKRLFLPETWFDERTPIVEPNVGCRVRSCFRANRNWQRKCCWPFAQKGYCRFATLAPIASMAIAPCFWMRWMPAWARSTWWVFPQRRGVGSSVLSPRRRPTATGARCTPGASWRLEVSRP